MDFDADNERGYRQAPEDSKLFKAYERITELEADLTATEESIINIEAHYIEQVGELQDFAIWMTGCGYDFCQHEYFCKQRDKLLKNRSASESQAMESE